MNFKLVIPSYNRADRIVGHPLLAEAHVLVAESQLEQYRATIGDDCKALITHPNLLGMAVTRNFIINEVYDPKSEDFVFMCDDDLNYVRFMHSRRVINYKKAPHLMDVIAHTARLALDAGTNVFGYAITVRPQERMSVLPFAFRRIVESNAMGIVGQKQQFDSNCVVSSDIDFSLQSIQTHRVVVQDLRYAWVFDRWSAGGLAAVRTTEAMERSHNYLIKKWGRGIVATNRKRRSTGLSVTVRVS